MEITSQGKNGIEFTGERGKLFVSRQTLRGEVVDRLQEEPLDEESMRRLYKGTLPQGPHAHLRNFFASIVSRQQPISDVYSHHRALTTCHLANIALRLGRELRWDPDSERLLDDPVAASMLARAARAGYEIDP